jgi:hypothetical protein
MLPVSSFIGAKFNSSVAVDLYFEKAPFSYKVTLSTTTYKGDEVMKALGLLFNNSPEPVIVFSDPEQRYDVNGVTAVASYTKIVVK